MRQQLLVIGDYTNFKYHVFNNMDLAMQQLLGDKMEVVCTEDYGELEPDRIRAYALVVCYSDRWGTALPDEQAEGLKDYVRGGGGLLVIHNGISLQARQDLMEMIGAKFTGHPPYCRIEVKAALPAHEWLQGVETFSITDEPYRFELLPGTKTRILLEYEHEGAVHPAGWTHSYGDGQVAYLMPGHDGSSFLNDTYRGLLRQVCLAMAKRDARS